MWRKCVLIVVLIASLELQVKGKFHIKPKSHKNKGQWPVDKESRQVKRDTVPAANGYPSYGSQYAAQSGPSYNSAVYNSANAGQGRSAMPYPASSPSPAPATAASSSSSSSPASATAAAAASPQGGVAATAQAATAPAASPAASAPAPAPAAASPAPAPAAPAPASAPASPASAPASSTPVEASAPARASVPYTAQASTAYRPSSQSYSYNYNPAPAPYYASYPAPAAYAYPAPAPARSATTLIAAAVAQVAKSTSTQGSAKAHARSNTAGVCIDDERASNFCLKARNPCFCEENHHFMYNYCKDSCNWCDSSENVGHKFWRLVNEARLARSWVIENIKFYSDKHAKIPLETKPAKAFASSSYLGYEPASAFDNKSSTYWLPNGWYDRGAGEDFIGYEFDQPVAINSVRVIHQKGQGNVVSTKMYVEASDAYGGPYATKWIIENPKGISNKRFNNKSKYFQPKQLAGGLTLVGGGDYSSGIFGMEFSKPRYSFPTGSFQLDINFSFKKSVFFADYVIICLGTGITSSNSSPYITQTVLFQNKLLNSEDPSSILINTTPHSLSTDLTKEPSFFGDGNNAATLKDVNGNGYYIPNPNSQGLNLKISLQTSRNQNGGARETSARYATAWLNHGSNPSDATYEYTIVVNKPANELATRQVSDNKVYEVLHKDNKAHVVKINDCPRAGKTQYGYVFFKISARTPGPVKCVNKVPCIVMVEEADNNNLYIAVSSPDLNFNISRNLKLGSPVKGDERFYSISMPVEIEVVVTNDVHVATGDVRVNGAVVPDSDKTDHVEVKPKRHGATEGRVIKFKQLVKGFSKEVKLTR